MAEKTKIGWCNHTLNFHKGCTKVSEECKFCYIGPLLKRSGVKPFGRAYRTVASTWRNAFKWDKAAERDGVRRRVFTCSLSDFFHPHADQWRQEAWDVIRKCRHLDWLVLTKRPELIAERLPEDWGNGFPNVWLGATVGTSASMHRIPLLQAIPAKVRFISAEPLLEALDFRPYLDGSLHWIITGCERAAKGQRRLMDMDWVRDIDRQCGDAKIAHFFKQHYVADKGVPVEDGLLDGKVRQAWPQVK